MMTITEMEGSRSYSQKVPVNRGINRWQWPLYLQYSEQEITTYREKQQNTIDGLRQVVKDKGRKKKLKEIEEELEEATNLKAINEVRSKLVKHFNMYST